MPCKDPPLLASRAEDSASLADAFPQGRCQTRHHDDNRCRGDGNLLCRPDAVPGPLRRETPNPQQCMVPTALGMQLEHLQVLEIEIGNNEYNRTLCNNDLIIRNNSVITEACFLHYK